VALLRINAFRLKVSEALYLFFVHLESVFYSKTHGQRIKLLVSVWL
jgi:hypothetical protein